MKEYKNRKQMMRENFAGDNLTQLTAEQIKEKYEIESGDAVRFELEAYSVGTYGVNGAIVNVYQKHNSYNEIYSTFHIDERNTTIFYFIA